MCTWGGSHVELNLAKDRIVVGWDPACHPFAALYQQFLLLPAEDTNPDRLVGPQCDFPPTSGAATYVAVVAEVSYAIRKLGLQTDLTRSFKLNSCLLLCLRLGLDLLFEADHLVLLGLEELDLAALLRLSEAQGHPCHCLQLSLTCCFCITP